MKLRQLRLALKSLCAYQSLESEPVMEEMMRLLEHIAALEDDAGNEWLADSTLNQYGAVFFQLRQGKHLGFGDFLWDYLRFTPTLYGTLVAEGGSDPALENSARREVETLVSLAKLDCDFILTEISKSLSAEDCGVLGDLPRWSSHCAFDFETLTQFHKTQGCGIFAQYQQFSWRNGKLIPLKRVKAVAFSEMKGYELQRNQVMENTRKLVAGMEAQNVLLFGDGGTGKSAVVKSMACVPEFKNLRLIQAENSSLGNLPDLISQLEKSHYKFIIFIDDLAFDQDDNTYSALKSILEGGLETPPENVVVYATSNRRHLVRQNFADRAGDEVDRTETISEKTALSERFGLRIPYLSMSKTEYLDLVDFLYEEKLKEGCIAYSTSEQRHHKAMMWEIRHGGRTPRVARQFICSL